MANKGKLQTIFQGLNKTLSGWDSGNYTTNVKKVNSYSYGDKVILKTTDKDEYNKAKLQAKQDKFLSKQWVNANLKVQDESLMTLNYVDLMYRDAELMDGWPEISAALDTYAEESCLDGSTTIKLLNGEIKTIKELYDGKYKNFWVYSVDENGNCKPSLIEKVIYKGIKDTYKLTLDDGTEIICTPDHKLLKNDITWEKVENLKFGDSLMSIGELAENVDNHRVIKIEKGCNVPVYDLFNSTVNNSFAIKCKSGHIISHNCNLSDKGNIINIYSKSPRIKTILEDLFVTRLQIHTTLPMITRATCKYGNNFQILNVNSENGVMGWRQLPVFEVKRFDNDFEYQYNIGTNNGVTEDNLTPHFRWENSGGYTIFKTWQIAHFRLLLNSFFLPMGCSLLNGARRHWRILALMEDSMLIYRLERSFERLLVKVDVGAIDDTDVPAYINDIANNFKRTPHVDPLTGQLDLRKNMLGVDQSIFIPVRNQNDATKFDILPGATNLDKIEDLTYIQNKVLTALRIPKTFLGFDTNIGDGKNLALMDIRFTRTINRVQQSLIMELTKIAIVHLYMLGFQDDLNNFTITMNNPSTQAEILRIEELQKKILLIKDALSDPGNGIQIMSYRRALKEILKWSDEEISDNLNEIRLEKAIAAELVFTSQIIKRTGVFDPVDKIYGSPDAQYDGIENYPPELEGMAGGGSGGGMMGGDLGGGMGEDDFDFEGDTGDDIQGDTEAAPISPMGESKNKTLESTLKDLDNIITEQNANLKAKVYNRKEMYMDLYMKKLKNPVNENSTIKKYTKTEMLDDNFFINEKYSKMESELNEYLNKL